MADATRRSQREVPGMGYVNISDGSITPTPPSSPSDGVEDMYAADEQFANVYWQSVQGIWHEMRCPAGLVYNIDNNVCDWSRDANNPAQYVLDDPSLA